MGKTSPEYSKKYYLKHKERIAKYHATRLTRDQELRRIRHRKDPRKVMMSQARQRAKRKELEFSITIDDIQVPEICPILNIPIFVWIGKSGPNSPTLDRIDNTKGYTPDNIAVISRDANTFKGDKTQQDVERLLNYMKVIKQ